MKAKKELKYLESLANPNLLRRTDNDTYFVLFCFYCTVYFHIGFALAILTTEHISLLLGNESGWLGVIIATFPVAGVLLKKGSKLSNALIMLGTWSTTKISLLLFEASSMKIKFAIIRLVFNLFSIVAIAYVTEKILHKDENEEYIINKW
ncbi:hypothetical protein [Proteiniborus sp.]|uniref:hypothetical protein n=1 Tax=Proteiniborus sp. TaxID=2079015 RepID=UPI00331FD07B